MSSKKLNIHGILLLDKPLGISSNQALQKAKRIFNAAKAGHTGSLDPLASGVLPICFGEATKFSQHLLDADKVYEVEGVLGQRTSTGDAEGEIIETHDTSKITEETLRASIRCFIGSIQQIPPMYSALKQNGQPLYKLARQGIEVERAAREVTIYEITIDQISLPRFRLTVSCSKGTYIRTLIEDIGTALDCGAYVAMLRRTKAGPFTITSSYSLADLENRDIKELLLPIDSAITDWPLVIVTEEQAFYLRRGQEVETDVLPSSQKYVRIVTQAQEFIGLGEIMTNRLLPRRLVSSS